MIHPSTPFMGSSTPGQRERPFPVFGTSTQRGFLLLRGLLVLLLSLFATSCFDYEERIHFAPDFTGYVDYEYVVPIHPDTGRSMLAFLPVEEENISKRYSGFFTEREVPLENYSVEYSEVKGDPGVTRQAKVSYRVRFSKPEELESLLIGKTTVYWRNRKLHIQRIFPAAQTLPDSAGPVTRRINTITSQSFSGKRLRFYLYFPWYYDLFTNQGSFLKPGLQTFTLPLENTLKSGTGTFWNVEIRANPRPEGGF